MWELGRGAVLLLNVRLHQTEVDAGYRCCEEEFISVPCLAVLCCAVLYMCVEDARRCVGRSLDCATATMRRREGGSTTAQQHSSTAQQHSSTAAQHSTVLG